MGKTVGDKYIYCTECQKIMKYIYHSKEESSNGRIKTTIYCCSKCDTKFVLGVDIS